MQFVCKETKEKNIALVKLNTYIWHKKSVNNEMKLAPSVSDWH